MRTKVRLLFINEQKTMQTLKFTGTFRQSELLTNLVCRKCQNPLTRQEISARNYSLLVSDFQNQVIQEKYDNHLFYSLKF